MIKKDDKGLSLLTLIQHCKKLFSDSLTTLLNIDKIVRTCETSYLETIVFNEKYLVDNMKIFDSREIPKIKEKTDAGIFNIEFDSNLSNSSSLSTQEIIEWIQL